MIMTTDAWLKSTTASLRAAGIETARLDALVLLEDCLSADRATILAYPETELTAEHIAVLDEQIKRRCGHEPLAYIRGKTEFYGRDFEVNKNALEPRPESETIIEVLKKLYAAAYTGCSLPVNPVSIIDVGTGSGALAITAKLELPMSDVTAIDIDPACVRLAQQNADRMQAEITFLTGDLLAPLDNQRPDPVVLLCNLPYVPDTFHINQAATREPKLAIFGGSDGLDHYRALFKQLQQREWQPNHIITESLPAQHAALSVLAARYGYDVSMTDDFIQVFAAN